MRSSRVSQRLLEAARRLCPERIEAIAELRRGHNNRIFQLATRNRRFALKAYSTTDPRDRQGAEARALEFLERAGIPATPRLVAWDASARCSLLTWLDGTPVTSVTDADVDQFAQTQLALDRAADGYARATIGEASEACLSGRRILSHIGRRIDRLAEIKPRLPRLAAFCDGALLPALDRFEREARAAYADLGLDFDADIPEGRRTLIASDMGAHNALRAPDGTLYLLDFEYFGWDDPLTSVANFVLHPSMRLSERQARSFTTTVLGSSDAAESGARLSALMPLYALRWCTIILGEFLLERWRHRRGSGAEIGSWDETRRAQLDKAEALLARFWMA